MGRKRSIFEGDIRPSNKFGDFVVLEYVNAHDITIKFINTGTVVKTASSHILRGLVRDNFAPTLYGIGWVGDKHPTISSKGKMHPVYAKWSGMFERCYGDRIASLSYRRNCVTVHEHFHSYEHFWEFFHDLPNHGKEGWNLDKDLLSGVIYAPDTVCMLPPEINMAMIVDSVRNSSGYPGVRQRGSKFSARIMKGDVEHHLGMFFTPEQAYESYRKAKNEWVSELADSYRDELPYEIYSRLVDWFPNNHLTGGADMVGFGES